MLVLSPASSAEPCLAQANLNVARRIEEGVPLSHHPSTQKPV